MKYNKIKEFSIENSWLCVSWVECSTTTQEFIIDNEIEYKEVVIEIPLGCWSYSGEKEHIDHLRNKAKEFGTLLDEYEPLIKQCENNFIYPTEDELAKEELQNKIQEANYYLAQTDWVSTYKIRHDLGLELIPEDSSKWEVINKREEYIVFLKAIEGAK